MERDMKAMKFTAGILLILADLVCGSLIAWGQSETNLSSPPVPAATVGPSGSNETLPSGQPSSGKTGAAAATDRTGKRQKSVLDFDADVIEGERAQPDVFLEFGNEAQTMESVVFKRTDFNDFHEVSMKRRLKHLSLGGKR
jgi:hypothetical protein